jgi:hypothetical protein
MRIIEEINNLHGITAGRIIGKGQKVNEEKCHAIKEFRWHGLFFSQQLDNLTTKTISNKSNSFHQLFSINLASNTLKTNEEQHKR